MLSRRLPRLPAPSPFLAAILAAAAAGVMHLVTAPSALAQPDEPAATPPATAAPRPEDDTDAAQWRHDYAVARERLLAGDFGDAADRFDALAREPTAAPSDRVLAASMRDLARSWADRGLALIKRNDLGESSLPARAVNERSTDEIAQLYVASVLYGVGTGAWIDTLTQSQSTPGVVLPVLLFAAAAPASVALVDVGHPLHYGVAQSTVSGMWLGLEEGTLLALWNESQSDQGAHWQGSTAASAVWALSTVGAVGGGVLGTSLGATPGRAAFVGSAGLWAATLTGLTAGAMGGSGSDSGSAALLAANVGLGAGVAAGLLAAGPVSPSIARVRFLDLGGIGGGLLGGGLYLAAANQGGSTQALLGTTALGMAAGLGVAWFATGKIPGDRPEDRRPVGMMLQPTLAPVQGGATVGLMGAM